MTEGYESVRADAGSFGNDVLANDLAPRTSGPPGRSGPMEASMHLNVADYSAAGRACRPVAVLDYDED